MLNLLFGFNGRINRSRYWLGVLISGGGGGMVLALVFAMGIANRTADDPDAMLAALGATMLAIVPIMLVLAWCGLALQVKRFHDRNKSGWLAAIPFALGAGSSLLTLIAPVLALMVGPLVLIATIGLNIWFFVELGCLPSVDGPNRFDGPPEGSARAPSGNPRIDRMLKPTLGSAEAAIERAIADRAHQPAAAPKPTPAMPAAPRVGAAAATPTASFGRRAAR